MQLSIFFFAIRNDSPGIFACRPSEDKFFERQPIHNITYFNESQAFLKKNLKIFRFFSIFCAFAPEKSFFSLAIERKRAQAERNNVLVAPLAFPSYVHAHAQVI